MTTLARAQHAQHLSRLLARSCAPRVGRQQQPCLRRAMLSGFAPSQASAATTARARDDPVVDQPPFVVPAEATPTSSSASPQVAARPPSPPKAEKPRPQIKATKAAITVTPTAIERLKDLLSGPNPQYIRIGVRNKGCAGLSYHLEYVDKPGRFDEVVDQDGVKVLIDSKALFSIIGSEMDWQDDKLSSKFAFKNPNIKDACGCGESFTV